MAAVKHRRNHAVTALGLIVASGLAATGGYRPVIIVRGPQGSMELAKGLGLGLDPSAASGLDEASQAILLGASVAVAVIGLLLLVTRVRYLGLLLRLIALLFLAVPATLTVLWWRFVSDPVAAMQSQEPSIPEQVAGAAGDILNALGLVRVTAGDGLYLISAGTATGILACLVPAFRSVKTIESDIEYRPPISPGWYVNNNDPRFVDFWDGRAWVKSQPRGSEDTGLNS